MTFIKSIKFISDLLFIPFLCSRASFASESLPLDFYELERDLFSSLCRSTLTKLNEICVFKPLPLDFYKVERVLFLTLSDPGGGGGRLRGPNDQTHSCQSETSNSMMPKLGDF